MSPSEGRTGGVPGPVKAYLFCTLFVILLSFSIFAAPLALCLPGPVSILLAFLALLFSESVSVQMVALWFLCVFGPFFLTAALLALLRKTPLPLLIAASLDPLARLLLLAALLQEELARSSGDLMICLGILVSSVCAWLLWRAYAADKC